MIQSSQPLHAVQLCWVLTDTSQQQLCYPKQNRENNNESLAFVTIFHLRRAVVAAHSGCPRILLPQLNSCSLIYITNLATIKIPGLLVNSLSLSRSTSHHWFVVELWQLCHVMQMTRQPVQICVRRTLALSDREAVWALNQRRLRVQLTLATSDGSNSKHCGCNHQNRWINTTHIKDGLTKWHNVRRTGSFWASAKFWLWNHCYCFNNTKLNQTNLQIGNTEILLLSAI